MTCLNLRKIFAALFLTLALSTGLCSTSRDAESRTSRTLTPETNPWVPVTVDEKQVVHFAGLHLPVVIRIPKGTHLVFQRVLVEQGLNALNKHTVQISLFLRPADASALKSHLDNDLPENLLSSPGIHRAKVKPRMAPFKSGWVYAASWITNAGYANVNIGSDPAPKPAEQNMGGFDPITDKIFRDLSAPISPVKSGKPVLQMVIAIVTTKAK